MRSFPSVAASARPSAGRRVLCLLFAIWAMPLHAGEVYGRVTLEGRPFAGSVTLPDGTSMPVRNGEYSAFLIPGSHQLTFRNGREWTVRVQSIPQRRQQDVTLQ
jgi:hypothetical protein